MFAYSGLSKEQVERMRDEFSVYGTLDGSAWLGWKPSPPHFQLPFAGDKQILNSLPKVYILLTARFHLLTSTTLHQELEKI
jgi:hypothetical protein